MPETTPHVLVVEDDRDVRDCLLTALRTEGYSVDAAVDGVDALHAVRDRRPDVVVLDLMMPVMDGRSFLAAHRADPATASIPVIVTTAAPQLRVDGVAAFIPKPFDLDVLLGAVDRCVGPARPRPAESAA